MSKETLKILKTLVVLSDGQDKESKEAVKYHQTNNGWFKETIDTYRIGAERYRGVIVFTPMSDDEIVGVFTDENLD